MRQILRAASSWLKANKREALLFGAGALFMFLVLASLGCKSAPIVPPQDAPGVDAPCDAGG
jgi:hypothetical protein